MDFKTISLSIESGIAVAKINKLLDLEGLRGHVLKELNALATIIEDDDVVDILILTGEDESFFPETDMIDIIEICNDRMRLFGDKGAITFKAIERMTKPTIAAVNGSALGMGCELALSCDMRIASERAQFGQPDLWLGMLPGFSGAWHLSRLIHSAKAKELLFTGALIGADEAQQLGIVNHIVSSESLLERAMDLAKTIQQRI